MRYIFLIVSILVIVFLSPAEAAFSGGGPQPGDVYKEFAVTMGKKNWRVTDPDISITQYPAAEAHLPNAVIDLPIDDLQGATRAEIVIDFWEGHDGTTDKKFRLNGKPWIQIPEPVGNKYMQQVNHLIPIPLSNLVQGTNRLQGTCDRNNWNWGQWGWFGVIVRVYYDSSKGHATGQITSPTSNSSFGENPAVTATASGDADRVDFVAYYDGFDKDGDGVYLGWQRDYHRTSWNQQIGIRNHVGTDTSAPYSVSWNTEWVPDQATNLIKLVARIRNSSGYWFVTPAITGLNLSRPDSSVKIFKPFDVPERYWVRDGKSKSSKVNISSLASFDSAIMQVATWNGNDGENDSYSKVNSFQMPLFGVDHFYSYDEVPVPESALMTGTNIIKFYSGTIHHGIEILWPGPAISVRYGTAAPPPPPPDPDTDPDIDPDIDPTGDVVSNGGFESNMTSWSFYTNGSGSAVTKSPGYSGSGNAAQIVINSLGSNTQLLQSGIPLRPNTEYRLSFAAYSNTGNDLRVSLAKHTSPYTNYGLSQTKVDLSSDWGMHTLEFTTQNFNTPIDDCRLYFWFGSDAKSGDRYCIDEIYLASIDSGSPPTSDGEKPSVPSGLTASLASDSSAELSWIASTDNVSVSGYKVYRDGIEIGSSSTISFLDDGLDPSSSFVYTVTAFDEAGNESSPSGGKSVETPAADTPDPSVDPLLLLGMGFDETDGNTVFDASPNQNDGTLTSGVTRDPSGYFGGALRFSGSGGQVDLGNLDIPGEALTLACWFRADDFGSNSMDGRILSKASGVQGDEHYWMLSTIKSEGIKPRFRLKTTGGGTTTLIGTTVLQAGTWTHLAATYDGAVMRLFVNGVLAGSTAKSGQIIQAPSVPAAIGDQPQGNRSFDGLIDDLMIFTDALDQSGIEQLMLDGNSGPPASDSESPSTPAGFSATLASDSSAALSWNASTDNVGVTGYRVCRDGAEIGTTSSISFLDEGLAPSSSFVYTVKAFDEAGNESSVSVEESLETPSANTPPSAPANLQTSGISETQIGLSWEASTDDGSVTEYRVFRNGTLIGTSSTESFMDSGLDASSTYQYQVQAVDDDLNTSVLSSSVPGSTLADTSVPGPEPALNELLNGGFETDLSSWFFYTNGSGDASVASPGYDGSDRAVLVALNSIGSNIQLMQWGIPLEPNTDYELTFAAYSNSGHDLRISLNKHKSPYTIYGLNRVVVDVTTGWQFFTVSFTSKNFSSPVSDGRLSFWFASDAKPGDWYFLDEVRLLKLE